MKKNSFLNVIAHIYLAGFAFLCILPFFLMFSSSVTDEEYLKVHGFGLVPHNFSLKAYSFIFTNDSSIGKAYMITIFVTVMGTLLSMIITSMLAYSISRKELKYARAISLFVFFTMLFNGGLVPWFLVVSKYLHLTDTVWALILPSVVSAFNMFLLKNFFSTIDTAMLESARIDGANEFRILFRIVLPLSLPGVVTVSLFYALYFWNDWWLALMFINKRGFYPLQYLLRMIISSIEYVASDAKGAKFAQFSIPSQGVRMATTIVTIGPIIFLYPFVQKYFIKGLTVGGVKG